MEGIFNSERGRSVGSPKNDARATDLILGTSETSPADYPPATQQADLTKCLNLLREEAKLELHVQWSERQNPNMTWKIGAGEEIYDDPDIHPNAPALFSVLVTLLITQFTSLVPGRRCSRCQQVFDPTTRKRPDSTQRHYTSRRTQSAWCSDECKAQDDYERKQRSRSKQMEPET